MSKALHGATTELGLRPFQTTVDPEIDILKGPAK